jgi:hypothetical protein
MAHVQILDQTCRDCPARATRELFNNVNASVGVFCTKHSQAALIEQTRREKEQKKDK